jgi:hypothetical protein
MTAAIGTGPGCKPHSRRSTQQHRVWWQYHGRLITEAAMLPRACPVRALMPDGRLSEQRVAAGARVRAADGLLVRGGG